MAKPAGSGWRIAEWSRDNLTELARGGAICCRHPGPCSSGFSGIASEDWERIRPEVEVGWPAIPIMTANDSFFCAVAKAGHSRNGLR